MFLSQDMDDETTKAVMKLLGIRPGWSSRRSRIASTRAASFCSVLIITPDRHRSGFQRAAAAAAAGAGAGAEASERGLFNCHVKLQLSC